MIRLLSALGVASIAVHFCVSSRNGEERKDPYNFGIFPKTVSWCAAVSGNGGNWASTVGFLAESLDSYLKDQHEKKLVDLLCMVGGSSGSATTLLLMRLLQNPTFGISGRLASLSQARTISKALHLLAMALDSRTRSTIDTLARVAGVKLQVWGDDTWEKNGVAVGVSGNVLQFKDGLVLARYMPQEWLDLKVHDMIKNHCGWKLRKCDVDKTHLKAVAEDFGMRLVTDLPEMRNIWRGTSGGEEHLVVTSETALEKEQVLHIASDVAQGVKKITSKFLGCGGICGKVTGLYRENHIKGFAESMQGPPLDGFVTVTFAAKLHSKSPNDVSYESLRVMAFMSAQTAEAILRSKAYRNRLSACRSAVPDPECMHTDRYVLAVVDKLMPMIELSTMEPGMNRPSVQPLTDFGILSFFDPLIVQDDPSELSLIAVTVDGEGVKNPTYAMIGGFVDRGQSVPLLEYYQEGVHGHDVAFTLFGKSEAPRTAVKAVKEFLTHSGYAEDQAKEGDLNWIDFESWSKYRPENTLIDGYLDWDCGEKIPANLRGDSWKLRLHGAARARLARGGLTDFGSTRSAPKIVDPMEGCEEPWITIDSGSEPRIIRGQWSY